MQSKPIVIAALCALVLAGGVLAQASSPGPLYLVHQEIVKPSLAGQYELASKEFQAAVSRNAAAMSHFRYTCVMSDDFVYTYVLPLAGYATIDALNQEFAALMQKEGAKFVDVMSRSNAASESIREWVVQEAPELSYVAATARVKPEEMKYFRYDFYYLMADKQDAADALAKDFLALYKSKNMPTSYRIFKTALGADMPALIVEAGAKDAADFYAQDAREQALLGEAAKPLFERALSISRRVEHKSGWLRPDLSVMPTAPAAKK